MNQRGEPSVVVGAPEYRTGLLAESRLVESNRGRCRSESPDRRLSGAIRTPDAASRIFMRRSLRHNAPSAQRAAFFIRSAGTSAKVYDCLGQSRSAGHLEQSDAGPFERPKELGGEGFLHQREATNSSGPILKRLNDAVNIVDPVVGVRGKRSQLRPKVWRSGLDESKVSPNRRTSLVIDPPDGKIRIPPRGESDGSRCRASKEKSSGNRRPPTARRTAPSSSDASQPGGCSSPIRSITTTTTSSRHPGTS